MDMRTPRTSREHAGHLAAPANAPRAMSGALTSGAGGASGGTGCSRRSAPVPPKVPGLSPVLLPPVQVRASPHPNQAGCSRPGCGHRRGLPPRRIRTMRWSSLQPRTRLGVLRRAGYVKPSRRTIVRGATRTDRWGSWIASWPARLRPWAPPNPEAAWLTATKKPSRHASVVSRATAYGLGPGDSHAISR